MFVKATKEKAKGRLALAGPSGGGKTASGLAIGTAIIDEGERLAVLDTENGSARKYSHLYDFDVVEIRDNYHPDRVREVIAEASKTHGALLIDSITHFWNSTGGFLDLVDGEVKRMQAKGQKADSFAAWKTIDPIYRRMVQAMLAAPIHIIVTMRAKQSYEKVEENGRTKIQKMGLAPQMRDEFQYEMDVEGTLNMEHDFIIGKTRCPPLDGKIFNKPGKDFAAMYKSWLVDGADAVVQPSGHTVFLQTISAVTNSDDYKRVAETYQAGKGGYSATELQEQMRALRAKHDELKAAAGAA